MKASKTLVATVVLSALPLMSWASLGDNQASVNTDASALNASVTTENNVNYTLYTLTLPSKTVVKEYVSNDKVFAVTWKGPHNPNVNQVIGNYFGRLQDKPLFADHSSAKFVEPDFRAFVRGSIHNHHGKAFLPQYLPANVTGKDIK